MGSDLIVLRLPFDFQHECCVQRSRVKEYEGMVSRYRRSRGGGGSMLKACRVVRIYMLCARYGASTKVAVRQVRLWLAVVGGWRNTS